MPCQNSACILTTKAGTSSAKVDSLLFFSLSYFALCSIQAYSSLASSEIIDSVAIIERFLPVENNQKATEVFSEAAKENAKVSDVINRIHNEALQHLPDVRQRFFIRYRRRKYFKYSMLNDF